MATLAQSIKHTATLDNGEVYTNTVSTKTVTLTAGGNAHKTTQEVTTSFLALQVGAVPITATNDYFVTVRNTSNTDGVLLYINFSTSTAGSEFLVLDAGEHAGFPVKGGVNVFLRGSVALDAEVTVVGA
jgi:hypothetical protein